jgi:hypothetical protein
MNGRLKVIDITQGMTKLSLIPRYLSSNSTPVEPLYTETHAHADALEDK